MLVDIPYSGYILRALNFRILTTRPKLKHTTIQRVLLHLVAYPKILTVKYLIHVSFHASKYTRYTELIYYLYSVCYMYSCKCIKCIHVHAV